MSDKEFLENENMNLEEYPVEEYCSCECECDIKEPTEEPPALWILFDTTETYHKYPMFRRIQEELNVASGHRLYVFFNMGSINLDVDNGLNVIKVHDGFVEIFNAENGELTFLKTEEIKGFVFEPKPVELSDIEEEEVIDD